MLLFLGSFPPCRHSVAVCTQPFVEHSVWMIIWGFFCHIFSDFKVSSFPSTKGVPHWLKFSAPHDHCRSSFSERLISVEDIETGFVLVNDSRPINFARFKTSFWLLENFLASLRHRLYFFSPKGPKTFSLYLELSQETLFVLLDKGMIFWGWS